jgi:hypothetical protein
MSNKNKNKFAASENNAAQEDSPRPTDAAPGPTGHAPTPTSPIKFVLIIFALAAILIGLAKFLRG